MQIPKLYLAAAALVALTAGLPALAIQPTAANLVVGTTNAVVASSTIERGGTVSSVDWRKRVLVVDNISFAVSPSPVSVHGPAGQSNTRIDLKPGMQIRFSTSRQNFSANEQVVEIWVTDTRTKASGK